MNRWLLALALLGGCGLAIAEDKGASKKGPLAAAFAELASGDAAGVYNGSEYLARAGKTDASIPPRLVRMMWDPKLNERSRYWALRTLAELGPAAKPVMPDLVKAMNDTNPYFRLRGSLAVLRAGGPADKPLATLKELARGKDGMVRMESLTALADAGPLAKDSLPFLIDVAGGTDATEQAIAIWAIGRMGPAAKAAVPVLGKLVDHKKNHVRETTIEALGRLAPDVPEVLSPLLKAAARKGHDGDLAADALSRGGKAFVPELIKLLDDDNDEARAHAAHALRFMGRASAPAAGALARAAPKIMNPDSRNEAIGALGNGGPAGVPHLIGLLKDPRLRLKYPVAQALGRVGPSAKDAAPALLALLRDRAADAGDRRAAGEALVALGPGAAAAVPDLIALIPEKDIDVAQPAIEALGAVGPAAKDAVGPLIKVIQEESRSGDYTPRSDAAATALGRIGKAAEPAIPVLIAMLSSEKAQFAAEALGRFGPAAKEALKPLRDLYSNTGPENAIRAALAVTRIDPEASDGIRTLIDCLDHPRSRFPEYERRDGVKLLGLIGPRAKAALEPLRKLLDDKTELSARSALAVYRIHPGDAAALDSLIRTLAANDSFAVSAACEGLAEIGPAAKPAIPELRRVALFDSGYYERDQARLAIRAIDPAQEP
jgi:HEAT repeat protein